MSKHKTLVFKNNLACSNTSNISTVGFMIFSFMVIMLPLYIENVTFHFLFFLKY